MAAEKPDVWAKIRAGYIAGLKPRELAGKFGKSAKTISNRASAEGWDADREETGKEIGKLLPQAIASKMADQAAEIFAAQLHDLQVLWADVMTQARAVQTEATREVASKAGPMKIRMGALDRLAGLKQAAGALKDAQAGIRKALGIDDKVGADGASTADDDLDAAIAAAGESHQAIPVEPDELRPGGDPSGS